VLAAVDGVGVAVDDLEELVALGHLGPPGGVVEVLGAAVPEPQAKQAL
jgi:hypothetical protein